MGKGKYINQGYIEEIEHYLYNNLDIKPLLDVDEPKSLEAIKEILLDGEEIKAIPVKDLQFYMTNKGRVFNVDTLRQLKPLLYSTTFYIYVSGDRINFRETMEDIGFIYDHEVISNTYKQNNWGFKNLTK